MYQYIITILSFTMENDRLITGNNSSDLQPNPEECNSDYLLQIDTQQKIRGISANVHMGISAMGDTSHEQPNPEDCNYDYCSK